MIPYTHIEPEITTVGILLNREDERLIQNLTAKEFLDISYPENTLDEEGSIPTGADAPQTNWDRLKKAYGNPETSIAYDANVERYDNGNYDNIELVLGVEFWLPTNNIVRQTMQKLDNNVVKYEDFKGFLSEAQARLFRDPDYAQVLIYGNNGNIRVQNQGVTVYAYVRAAGTSDAGSWVNLSAFVMNQKTFVGLNGGNFSIEVAPIVGQFNGLTWDIDTDSIKGLTNAKANDNFIAQAHINRLQDNLLKRQEYFFHTVMQQNDLIFIKFENLVKDEKNPSVIQDFKLSPQEVARHDWDMIGMLDSSPQVVSSISNDIAIRLQGRDLMKAWIDDEVVFFPEQFATQIFGNQGQPTGDESKLVKRLYGDLLTFNTYARKSIQFCMQFIINQLRNTGYVSNDAFSGYDADKLSTTNKLDEANLWGKFDLPKSPFGQAQVQGLASLSNDNVSQATDEVVADGVWSIIKLIIDDSVRDRRTVDNAMFFGQGSLINFVRKICQEPFVEFFGDTYGNQYYLTVRKPPFDQESMVSLAYDVDVKTSVETKPGAITGKEQRLSDTIDKTTGRVLTTTQLKDVEVIGFEKKWEEATISDLTLSISDADVLTEDLSYDQTAFSWYSLKPIGLLNGVEDQMAWAYLRAVKFDEYADVFGNKPLQIVSNYTVFNPYSDKDEGTSLLIYEQQALHDLRYIVQSNAYLPFTRRGSISIKGDRRFKKGMFVHYLPTNEIFYVDAVTQGRSISNQQVDRSTTLQVSRGMVEPYIRGDTEIGGETVSYFNIIKTDIRTLKASGDANKVLSSWQVNQGVFDFFLNRRQWANPAGIFPSFSNIDSLRRLGSRLV